jgi:SAM-dependent methyltransferase
VIAEIARRVYSLEPHVYLNFDLHAVERLLLAKLGTRWGELSMLDLGVGAGRTTYTFGAISGRYVGVDYSPAMVRLARERVGESSRVTLTEGDARAMPEFANASFDVVLFSFNGIDSNDHDGRLAALREVRRVLRPDGVFLFSSHSLPALPPPLVLPAPDWRRPLRSLRFAGGAVKAWIRFRRANKNVDPEEARRRGWAILLEAHDFKMPLYYVTPAECERQVVAAGLWVDAIYDRAARRLDAPVACGDPWLFYWCRPAA